MELSPVITPQGQPVWNMGGRHAWKVLQHRGFVISLEWVGRDRKAQPAMCVWPASNIFAPGAVDGGAWVISRRAITEFVGFNRDDKCTGSASEHCVRECLEALPILGKDKNDKQAHMALIDVIVRFAPELVLMPATPRQVRDDLAGKAMWDVTATNKHTGKVLSEASV
ncbi:MAG: hypothetical protein EOP40_14515 [Rubrivivax sp.]|nr:MAG: hypothetical protein EOP40_14515 [Rubrivivax sp.]